MNSRWRRSRGKWVTGSDDDGSGGGGNPFPFDIAGLQLFIWGDAMTHSGQGSPITLVEDLSPNADDASGANITQPVTADEVVFNGHTSALIETGGHIDHNGPAIIGVASGVNQPWLMLASVRLVTNSVASVAGWGNSAINSRWVSSFSRGGANRDMANVKLRDSGASTTSEGPTTQDGAPTTFLWQTDGINITATLGGVAEVLSSPAQTSGPLTVDRFTWGATIIAGVYTAETRIWIRSGVVYKPVPSALDIDRLLEWMANDAAQVGS